MKPKSLPPQAKEGERESESIFGVPISKLEEWAARSTINRPEAIAARVALRLLRRPPVGKVRVPKLNPNIEKKWSGPEMWVKGVRFEEERRNKMAIYHGGVSEVWGEAALRSHCPVRRLNPTLFPPRGNKGGVGGISPQDKRDRDLGRAVRGMKPYQSLEKIDGQRTHEWALIDDGRCLRAGPTPESALRQSRRKKEGRG